MDPRTLDSIVMRGLLRSLVDPRPESVKMQELIERMRESNPDLAERMEQMMSLIDAGESTPGGAMETLFGDMPDAMELYKQVGATLDRLIGLPEGTSESLSHEQHPSR